MEDPWSATFDQLTDACQRFLTINSNHSASASYSDFSDDDEDPLGSPEISVKINDDLTVSSEENLHPVDTEYENSDEEELIEIAGRDSDVSSSSEKEFSSDDEDQVVPSSTEKICEIILGEELTLSVLREIAGDNSEGFNYGNEEAEGKEVPDKGISDVEEPTGNRSNPQPP